MSTGTSRTTAYELPSFLKGGTEMLEILILILLVKFLDLDFEYYY